MTVIKGPESMSRMSLYILSLLVLAIEGRQTERQPPIHSSLEYVTKCPTWKNGDKKLHVYDMLHQLKCLSLGNPLN